MASKLGKRSYAGPQGSSKGFKKPKTRVAKKKKTLMQKVASMVNNIESKFLDLAPIPGTAIGNHLYPTAGFINVVNAVAEGDDNTQRSGRQVTNTSVLLRIPLVTTGVGLARTMLVWDYQANGALPAVTDILQTANTVSPMNLNNRERFSIIFDEIWPMGLTTSDNYNHLVTCYKKFEVKSIYSGTTGVIASMTTGALLLLTIADVQTDATNGYVRVRFNDY